MSYNIAHVLFYRTDQGLICCKVSFGGTGISYKRDLAGKYKHNKGEDQEQYPYIVSFDYIEAFLDANRIETCIVDSNSVKRFCGFSIGKRMHTFMNPTQDQVDEWHYHDAPNLYRFEIKTGEMSAYDIIHKNLLVEWGSESSFVSDQLSKIEVFLFTKNHTNAMASKVMMGRVV